MLLVQFIPSPEVRTEYSPTATKIPFPKAMDWWRPLTPGYEWLVQAIALLDVRIRSGSPDAENRAIKRPLPYATALTSPNVADSTSAQLTPSFETVIVPSSPTETKV